MIKCSEILARKLTKITCEYVKYEDRLRTQQVTPITEAYTLDTDKVSKLTEAIIDLSDKNLKEGLEKISIAENNLFPEFAYGKKRLAILNKTRELFKVHPDLVLEYTTIDGDKEVCPINNANINDCINFYTNVRSKHKTYHTSLLKPLEYKLNKYIGREEVPEEIKQYLDLYELNEKVTQLLDMIDTMITSSDPTQVTIDSVDLKNNKVKAFARHFDNESHTIKEDVEFMIEFFSTLNEEELSNITFNKEEKDEIDEDSSDKLNETENQNSNVKDINKFLQYARNDKASYKTSFDNIIKNIGNAKTKEDIDYLRKNRDETIQKFIDQEGSLTEDEKETIEWLRGSYTKALTSRKKSIDETKDKDDLFDLNESGGMLTLRSLPQIMKNMYVRKKDIRKIQPNLLKIVKKCRTMEDIEFLRRDKNTGNQYLKNLAKRDPSRKKEIEEHIAWIKGPYTDAINERAKEIRAKKTKSKNESYMASFILEDDDEDFDMDEFESDYKEYDKSKDKLDKIKSDKVNDSEQKEEIKQTEAKMKSAESGLKKNSKNIANFLKKSLSLKSKNIDETLSIKNKALRVAVAALIIGGSAVFPAAVIGKIGGVIVSTTLVGGYSVKRANKTKAVLDTQIEYLQNHIDEEDDVVKKKELNLALKDLQSNRKDLANRIKTGQNIKNKITKGSSSSDMGYDY